MKLPILFILSILYINSCSKVEEPKDIMLEYQGEYTFEIMHHYSYMDAIGNSIPPMEQIVEVNKRYTVEGEIVKGSEKNTLEIHWGNDSIKYIEYNEVKKSTKMYYDEEQANFYFEYEGNRQYPQYFTKDSINFDFERTASFWYIKGGRK